MDERRKMMRFRAWRRGFREIDLVLGGFADDRVAIMDAQALDEFEHLLTAPDPDLYAWITSGMPAPPEFDCATLEDLRAFWRDPRP